MLKLYRVSARLGRSLTTRSASSSSSTSSSTSSSVPAPHYPAKPASTPAAAAQAPNLPAPWSTNQRSRELAYDDVRFEQTDLSLQPQPLSAMALIAEEPVRMVHGRIAECDGGNGPLGHPKIFINLDKPGPKPCGYCGLRFEQAPHHH